MERKNGWQLAEQARDATPDGVQHLLCTCIWDADLARYDLGGYVVEHLGDVDGVLAGGGRDRIPQEGEQVRRGAAPVSGPAAGIENCQVGEFLAGAGAGSCWTGSCTCPKCGPRAGKAGEPEDFAFRPSPSWPGGCWNQESPSPGLPGTRSTAATATCGGGWNEMSLPTTAIITGFSSATVV